MTALPRRVASVLVIAGAFCREAEAQQVPPSTAPFVPWGSPNPSVLPVTPWVSSRAVEPVFPERRATVWYSGQSWAVLGGSVLLTPLYGVGVAGLVFGGPIVHWAHGQTGRGFAVLGMNLGFSVLGFALGAGLTCTSGCRGDFGGLAIAIFGLTGAAIGLLTANIVNAAVLSYEDPPTARQTPARRSPRFTLVPQLNVSFDRAQLGVTGSF